MFRILILCASALCLPDGSLSAFPQSSRAVLLSTQTGEMSLRVDTQADEEESQGLRQRKFHHFLVTR